VVKLIPYFYSQQRDEHKSILESVRAELANAHAELTTLSSQHTEVLAQLKFEHEAVLIQVREDIVAGHLAELEQLRGESEELRREGERKVAQIVEVEGTLKEKVNTLVRVTEEKGVIEAEVNRLKERLRELEGERESSRGSELVNLEGERESAKEGELVSIEGQQDSAKGSELITLEGEEGVSAAIKNEELLSQKEALLTKEEELIKKRAELLKKEQMMAREIELAMTADDVTPETGSEDPSDKEAELMRIMKELVEKDELLRRSKAERGELAARLLSARTDESEMCKRMESSADTIRRLEQRINDLMERENHLNTELEQTKVGCLQSPPPLPLYVFPPPLHVPTDFTLYMV